METHEYTQVRGKQMGWLSMSERRKEIHNPLFYVSAYCVGCGRTRAVGTLFIRAVGTEYIGLVRVRVCLHTTFPMYTGIWVSVFLESGFSSLDSPAPFPATIFLDFVNLTTFLLFFFFRCQGQLRRPIVLPVSQFPRKL